MGFGFGHFDTKRFNLSFCDVGAKRRQFKTERRYGVSISSPTKSTLLTGVRN